MEKETCHVQLTIETEQEDDGRWIAEVLELSGVLKYGATRELAVEQAKALAIHVITERGAPAPHFAAINRASASILRVKVSV